MSGFLYPPLKDQKPFHKCTSAECWPPVVAACPDEQKA